MNIVQIISFVLIGAMTMSQGLAQDGEYFNATTGDWGTASNWSSNAVPASTDVAIISSNDTSTVNGTFNVASLSLGTDGGTTGSLNVQSGTLTGTNLDSSNDSGGAANVITIGGTGTLAIGTAAFDPSLGDVSNLVISGTGTLSSSSVLCLNGGGFTTVTMSGGTLSTGGNQLILNQNLTSSAYMFFTQSGGTVSTGDFLLTNNSRYTISGGTIQAGQLFIFAGSVFEVDGPGCSLSFSSLITPNVGGTLVFGFGSTGTSPLNISGAISSLNNINLIIDGSNFTGPYGLIPLILGSGTGGGNQFASVNIINNTQMPNATIEYHTDGVYLNTTQNLSPGFLAYGFASWDYGSPSPAGPEGIFPLMNRRATPRTIQQNNPFLTFQTGNYVLRLDAATLQIPNFGPYTGQGYEADATSTTPPSSVGSTAPPATLQLSVAVGGNTYTCASSAGINGILQAQGNPQQLTPIVNNYNYNEQYINIRTIEAGRFLNRMDHVGLIFKNGNTLLTNNNTGALGSNQILTDANGNPMGPRLEVTSWPDHIILTLDCSGLPSNYTATDEGITFTTGSASYSGTPTSPATGNLMKSIAIQMPSGAAYNTVNTTNANNFIPAATSIFTQLGTQPSVIPLGQIGENAPNNQGLTTTVPVSYDARLGAIRFDIPVNYRGEGSPTQPALDVVNFTATNSGATPVTLPLVFQKIYSDNTGANSYSLDYTSQTMVLCHADGTPTGVPVQITEDWNGGSPVSPLGEYAWTRGATMITVAPGQTSKLQLRIIYGYWGNAVTASHGTQCLIGDVDDYEWNTQASSPSGRFDSEGLGSWAGGISTFDPDQCIGDAFLCDFTAVCVASGVPGLSYFGTVGYGGGELLNYYDDSGTFEWDKGVKVASVWPGPNLTKTVYSGFTSDGNIHYTYTVSTPRSNDMNRMLIDFNYVVLNNITPDRIAMFQLAGEYYYPSTHLTIGYATGSVNGNTPTNPVTTQITPSATEGYFGTPIPFPVGSWLSIQDDPAGTVLPADRYMVLRRFAGTTNGQPFTPVLSTYTQIWGPSETLFELGWPNGSATLNAGDTFSGTIEIGLAAENTNPSSYWGSDSIYSNLVANQSQPYSGPANEAALNNLNVTALTGALLNNDPAYPIQITADTTTPVLADFVIAGGTQGNVPFTLSGVPLGTVCRLQIYNNDSTVWSDETSQAVYGNDYYQDYFNETTNTRDITWNLYKNNFDANASVRYRVVTNAIQSQAQIVTNGNFSTNASSYVTYNSINSYGQFYLGNAYINPTSPTDWTSNGSNIGIAGPDTLSGNPSIPGSTPYTGNGPVSSVIYTPAGVSTGMSVSDYLILESTTSSSTSVTQVVTLAANTSYVLTFAAAEVDTNTSGVPLVTLGDGVTDLVNDNSISTSTNANYVLNTVYFTTGSVAGPETLTLENNENTGVSVVDFSDVAITAVQ